MENPLLQTNVAIYREAEEETSLAGVAERATSLPDMVFAAVLSSSPSISSVSPLAVTFQLGRKEEADVAYWGDALTTELKGSGLSRASSSDRAVVLVASSSSSEVAHMVQTGGININSIQISIETEMEMEDPMQLKPSSSFPRAAIPSITPDHFIKPVELG